LFHSIAQEDVAESTHLKRDASKSYCRLPTGTHNKPQNKTDSVDHQLDGLLGRYDDLFEETQHLETGERDGEEE
jgi:hypothetical protein